VSASLTTLNVADIPIGEGRAIAAGATEVAVFRLRDGSVRALAARCPHRGGPLADGLLDGRVVVCPLHGRSYDLATGAESAGEPGVQPWAVSVATDGTVELGGPLAGA
jgi:nitrite reductase (NADH) small subunit